MEEKEITKFVEWLIQNEEAPTGSTAKEVVSWINELSTSEEGQQLLNKLVKKYRNKKSGLFKKGGKLHQLLCFKLGGKGPDCGCNKKIKSAEMGGFVDLDPNRLTTWTDPESKGGSYNAIYTDENGNGQYRYTSYPEGGHTLTVGRDTFASNPALFGADSLKYRPISEASPEALEWIQKIEQLRKQK